MAESVITKAQIIISKITLVNGASANSSFDVNTQGYNFYEYIMMLGDRIRITSGLTQEKIVRVPFGNTVYFDATVTNNNITINIVPGTYTVKAFVIGYKLII